MGDFSAFCTGTRTQDDYNRIVRASDICICMFHRKAGEYTIEEFNQALDEYVKNQSHPKTFVYIRALIEGEMEDEALKRFKEDLFDRVGHYWCNYATDDAMKLHFVMQLERIIPSVSGNASVTEGNHFKIENGVVSLYGHKIAELDNLSFAAENPEYLSLKESIARLNTEIARLRATGVAELQPMIDEKQAELYKKREKSQPIGEPAVRSCSIHQQADRERNSGERAQTVGDRDVRAREQQRGRGDFE